MDKVQMESLFDEYVSEPLIRAGFSRNGMTLYYSDGLTQVALKRGGGRLSGPGRISLIVCFRHAFLRDKNEKIPEIQTILPGNCPWVFGVDDIIFDGKWQFDPSKLMNLPYQSIFYDRQSETELVTYFQRRGETIINKFLPWALEKTPESALSEMTQYTDKWWIARLWEEDYRNYLKQVKN